MMMERVGREMKHGVGGYKREKQELCDAYSPVYKYAN